MSAKGNISILETAVAAAAAPVVVPVGKRILRADEGGFLEISKINFLLSKYKNREIHIDASRIHSFDPALSAPLMIIIRHCQINKNNISFINLGPLLRHQLELYKIVVPQSERVKRTSRKPSKPPLVYFGLQEFHPSQTVEFASYTKSALDRDQLPTMTDSLKEKFFEGIDELFENSALHSKSTLSNVASGVYNRNTNTIKFVFADGGHGIKGAYESRFGQEISADRAISWAMTPGSTTRQGGISGGLGLKIIREFILHNCGKLSIVSGEGHWCEKSGHCSRLKFPYAFPGTIVTIEINTLDQKRYNLAKIDPNSIW